MATEPDTSLQSVTNQDFAAQVRAERLNMIWRVTLVLVVLLTWLVVLVPDLEAIFALPAGLMVTVGSLACGFFLRRSQLEAAIWSFAIGLIIGVSVLMIEDSGAWREFVPFLGVTIVYVIGLLVPARALPLLTGMVLVPLFVVPWAADAALSLPTGGAFIAGMLVILAALITAQASGELYAVAEWALESYRRERTGAQRLYDSRQQVEKSLLRQRGLTMELEKTNSDLVEARRAAEEAKHFRGQFLANMSHELRTPLNAVIGFSETMLEFPLMYNNVELLMNTAATSRRLTTVASTC
ncbi:MAG: hypothetical protein HC915_17320 [Anaerolineae bacterium]|nr:hypothetical protein [Anaerolineae bacterium]